MLIISDIVIAFIGLLHVIFMGLEMFLWNKPIGLRVFGHTKEVAALSKVLAANQGLYNGFLAAGLFWGLCLSNDGTGLKVFFLSCIIVAGIFGAVTVNRKILFLQAIPAVIGVILVLLS